MSVFMNGGRGLNEETTPYFCLEDEEVLGWSDRIGHKFSITGNCAYTICLHLCILPYPIYLCEYVISSSTR